MSVHELFQQATEAMGREDPAAARGLLEEAVRLDPASEKLWRALASTRFLLDDYQAAADAWQRVLAFGSDRAPDHRRLGFCLRDLGRLDDAVAAFQRSLELDPDFANTYAGLGVCLFELGRLEESEEAFRKAIERDPEDRSGSLWNLGVMRMRSAPEEAEDLLRRAIEIDPDYREAHSALGTLLYETDRFAEAREALEQGRALGDLSAQNRACLGLVLAELGELSRGIEEYQQSLELAPHPARFRWLGKLLEKAGRTEEMNEAYRRAAELEEGVDQADE